MSNKLIIVVIVLVVAVAAIIGIVMAGKDSASEPAPAATEQTTKATAASADKAPVAQKEARDVAIARQKAAQALVESNPWPDTAKMKEYSVKVNNAAVKATQMDIAYCAPNPSVVLLTTQNSSLLVKNSDTVAHTLNYGSSGKVTVLPASSQTVNFDIKNLGFVPFRCDNQFSGMFVVNE